MEKINRTADAILGIIWNNIERLRDEFQSKHDELNEIGYSDKKSVPLINDKIKLQSMILMLQDLEYEIKYELPYINGYINGE